MNLSSLAVLTLLPVMVGPSPARVPTMHVVICSDAGNRTIEIPIPVDKPHQPEPCWAKACHASCSRKQIARAQ